MSDPELQSVRAQLYALSAQIQTESVARVAARIDSVETARVGDIQSANYVPGVSGWKLEQDGTFEINSCILGSAAKAPDRQMVSVEVASWSKYDLPKNAANLLQFMQAELQKVPEQYRHAAEFEEFDASYGNESFNARLFLSYSRLETEEELADRLEKAKVAGTHVSIKNGLLVVSHDGVVRYKIGNLDQPEPEQAEPFKVDGDKVYLSEAAIKDGIIKSPWPAAWGVRMQLGEDGKYYAAGIGCGIPSQILVSADRFAINDLSASDILRDIAGVIGETKLGQELKEQIDLLESNLADQVKAVIRKELMPGGLIHRPR
ncbi:DUF1983 domain-containing protein [Pseudomonas rhodesiae]|uniref:phage tail tip fiber protein n=1 Tax=Pseudomonas rhodesiae TaxID=76760 RepID=UPI0016130B8C